MNLASSFVEVWVVFSFFFFLSTTHGMCRVAFYSSFGKQRSCVCLDSLDTLFQTAECICFYPLQNRL